MNRRDFLKWLGVGAAVAAVPAGVAAAAPAASKVITRSEILGGQCYRGASFDPGWGKWMHYWRLKDRWAVADLSDDPHPTPEQHEVAWRAFERCFKGETVVPDVSRSES